METVKTEIIKIKGDKFFQTTDLLIRETPLVVRLNGTPCASLPRTPGHDQELALGFCFTEGILPTSAGTSVDIRETQPNIIDLRLDQPVLSQPLKDEALGDETQIVNQIFPSLGKIKAHFQVSSLMLQNLANQAREQQTLFSLTGASHAAFIFDRQGNHLFCFEDVARHNALDKAIGYALLNKLDLSDKILFLSGRANYTLVRKAARSRLPIVACVSASTSLAVALSRSVGMTLIGFLRGGQMNIYTGQERIRLGVNEHEQKR